MAFTHVCLWTLLAFALTWTVFYVTNRKKKTTDLADAAAEERRDCAADVIIVGAGVGGSALAYALAKDGRRVHIIERDMREPERMMGEFMQPGGRLMLSKLGLEDCLDGIDAQKATGMTVYKDGKEAVASFPVDNNNFPYDPSARSFHNGRFVQRLRQKASSLPSVRLEEGTVKSLIEEKGVIKGVIYKNKEMQFGCLLETRVKEKKAVRIASSTFRDWSFMANYEFHRLGRIWVLWRSTVRLTPVYKSDQIITCSVLLEGETEEFFCSFIYAKNLAEERKSLWEDLRNHHDSQLFQNKPWLLMGDYNEILDGEEHSDFDHAPTLPPGMRDFQDVVRYCDLTDLGSHGPLFTWCNKRDEGLICKKLDRVLINDVWLHRFPQAYCVFEAGGCSDHLRSRTHLNMGTPSARRPFKFVNSVANMPEFLPLIQSHWENSEALFHSTSAMFRFTKKLKELKQDIRTLSRDRLGDLVKRTKAAHTELCKKQEATLANPTVDAVNEEAAAYGTWLHVSELEEGFLKQKAKLHWLDVGDQNNKVFHNAVKIRETKNAIREIKCEDGTVAATQELIKQEAVRFFSSFLGHTPEDYEGISVEMLESLLQFRCSDENRAMLEKEVTNEEVKKVLFSMPANKSPGPDGYTSEFFKSAWPVIENDFTVAIQSFFKKGFLPKGVNTTILALIPKKENAQVMKDYRPISCCNVLYKVISKILANRLKDLLPQIVSSNQTAFVKDRLLMENVLLASELVKDYHKEDISPRCAMKIDISKAFDSVQWTFLLNTLQALNFPERFIHWIRLCVTTTTFSVQVNGELAGFFGSARGLRQGCALSPYLFVICMNVLSHLINKAAAEKKFGYHPRCQNILLTHLCFADDLMIFAEGTKRSVEGVITIFDKFASISGLKISLEKSTLYMAGIQQSTQEEILQNFPFEAGSLPVRYLGLPLMTKAMTSNDYLPLIEKIRNRISTWTSRFLSYGGRLQLIKSVLMSITNFWSSAFRLPGKCMKEVERLCSAFLWSGPDLKSHNAKIAWQVVCLPKGEGGLGLRPLKETNIVSGLKLIWRLLATKTSLWGQWIHKSLIRNKSFWDIRESSQQGSWMWRKILKLRETAKNLHKMEIKSGRNTSFWHDRWSSMGRMADLLGDRGCIDLGITKNSTVETVLTTHRRRRHRVDILNRIEAEIEGAKSKQRNEVDDVHLWKCRAGFKRKFLTCETWRLIRTEKPACEWAKAVWFSQATPKFAFITWLGMHNRLSTGDRMLKWNQGADTSCVFCQNPVESRNHIFFHCSYSHQIWKTLTKGLLGNHFTSDWELLRSLISGTALEKRYLLLLRYSFQATVHSIWRERNNRRHGEDHIPAPRLGQMIEKTIRNKISLLRCSGNQKYQDLLIIWFSTRT